MTNDFTKFSNIDDDLIIDLVLFCKWFRGIETRMNTKVYPYQVNLYCNICEKWHDKFEVSLHATEAREIRCENKHLIGWGMSREEIDFYKQVEEVKALRKQAEEEFNREADEHDDSEINN